MRIKCKNAIWPHFSAIIAANRFTSALYVLCICLQIHVLQRISAMQPIIAQRYANLEHLHLAFVLRSNCLHMLCFICDASIQHRLLSTIRVLCSANVWVLCILDVLRRTSGGVYITIGPQILEFRL